MQTVTSRVRRGAEFLDLHYANAPIPWWDLVDLDQLSLRSNRLCVLGQLEGDFCNGLIRTRCLNPKVLGFINRGPGPFEFARLTFAWEQEIMDRRHQAKVDELEQLIAACQQERERLQAEQEELRSRAQFKHYHLVA